MRTLVVDDDLVSRRLMRGLVSSFSECEVAVNGRDALELFTNRYTTGAPFDLICLDIMLPEMDGYEVLAAIRAFEDQAEVKEEQRVKVLLLTALEDPKVIGNAYLAGCQAIMCKPIDRQKLSNALTLAGVILERPC